MIPHSNSYLTSSLINKIESLLIKKDLQSDHLHDRVSSTFKDKFHLDNIYFTQSGSHALYWIIKGLNLSSDDEVILSTYVCPSVYNTVLSAGVKPVLCDIGNYWHMSPQTVEAKKTSKTKAIILVNLFGMYLDCAKFRYPGIFLINDLCQSFDVLRDGKKDHGDFAFFSFHPTKFVTAGNGGGFSILNPIASFQNHLRQDLRSTALSNINLVILEEQIKAYNSLVKIRQEIANLFFSEINKINTKYIEKNNNVFYRFPLVQESLDFSQTQYRFAEKNISVRRGVDQLVHRTIGLPDADFPHATKAYATTLSIPIYPSLKWEDAITISRVVSEILNT